MEMREGVQSAQEYYTRVMHTLDVSKMNTNTETLCVRRGKGEQIQDE